MFNDSVKLKWKGQEYDCPITMNLVKTMERNGFNILASAIEIDKGGIPPVSMVAELYAYLLNAGGCQVTDEDVYTSIMSDPVGNAELVKSARYALQMFFPNLDSSERVQGAKKD